MIPFLIDGVQSEESPIRFVVRILIAVYLVDAGLLLIVAPWTDLWLRNYFAGALPWLGEWMASPYTRGAVTGIGIVTTFAGIRELGAAMRARNDRPANAASDTRQP